MRRSKKKRKNLDSEQVSQTEKPKLEEVFPIDNLIQNPGYQLISRNTGCPNRFGQAQLGRTTIMVHGGLVGYTQGQYTIVRHFTSVGPWEGNIFKKRLIQFQSKLILIFYIVIPVHNQLIQSMGEWVEVPRQNIPQYHGLVFKTNHGHYF